MNLIDIGIDISILYVSSVFLTWFIVSYLRLGVLETFLVFSFLNIFNGILQAYFLPFSVIAKIRKDIEGIKIFGILSLGLLVGQFNLWMLAERFGWGSAIAIGVGSFLCGPISYSVVKNADWSKLFHE